jgi:heterodisulfide reductase subunit C
MNSKEIKIPGVLPQRETILRKSFLEHIKVIPDGEKIKACLQCATCSGSCPLSYAMDITPRELIALFRAGDIETILKSRTIWICASCYTCQARCPAGIKVTDIIYALKRTAMERNMVSKKYPVHALSDAFMSSIYTSGRLNEARLLVKYFLKTGFWKAFAYVPLGLKMMEKHKLNIRAPKIKNIDSFRKILAKARNMDMPVEKVKVTSISDMVGYKPIS